MAVMALLPGIAANLAQPERVGRATVQYACARSVLTRASGFVRAYDWTLNPYAGCSFGCSYCYARFFAPSDELVATWGTWVQVKTNAAAAVRRARRSRGRRRLDYGASIYMGSATDPYQPVERKLGITRAVLEELIEVQPLLTIQTRSPIAVRDSDLFGRFEHLCVNFTVPTDSERVRRRYEPHCASIETRLRAAECIAAAGVSVGISISPMLPIEDARAFADRIARAGASGCVTQYMKPPNVRFAAGSPSEALGKLREDGWSMQRFRATCDVIRGTLAEHGMRLYEGKNGYAPVE